ncbi:MAG: hypothetical protein A4E71_00544 [Smithella sp. PtaU1.Bin162]|nr:MAG: hypothetical protein A4E71_00544 [Smithella sp. PtaU1.Bin162]
MSTTWIKSCLAGLIMAKESLEKVVQSMASDVKEINQKMTHFLESYRDDYYRILYGFKQ